MAGRTPAEAVGAFLEPLQQAIGCLTPKVLNVSGGYHVADRPHALTLGDGDPVPLAGQHNLSLSVMQQYVLTESAGARGPWKVHTTAYLYELRRNDIELLVYHWHPSGVSSQTRPHLHIGPAAELGFKPIQGAHVPTGRIALEEVLRMAIVELGAQPRRKDWDQILERTQAGQPPNRAGRSTSTRAVRGPVRRLRFAPSCSDSLIAQPWSCSPPRSPR